MPSENESCEVPLESQSGIEKAEIEKVGQPADQVNPQQQKSEEDQYNAYIWYYFIRPQVASLLQSNDDIVNLDNLSGID